jgi:DNA repair protein RecO (recombination protein O)
MPTYKTRAIILKNYKLGEADKIVKMYSDEGHLISAVAKGCRKTGSRFRGRLELFCLVDLEMSEGRNLDIIGQADILRCFTDIPMDFYRFVFAEIVSNIILKTQQSGDKNPLLFKLLYASLNEINKTEPEDVIGLKKILCFFEARFLQVTGLGPMLKTCSRCNKSTSDLYKLGKEKVGFSIDYGGVLCRECCQVTGARVDLNCSSYRLLVDLFRLKIEDLINIEIDPYSLRKVCRLMEDYMVFHTYCTVDSFKYLKKIGI